MSQKKILLPIPFDSFVDMISQLGPEEKYQLWAILNKEIKQAEEDILEQDTGVQSEIQEARNAYNSGDHLTLDEYAILAKDKRIYEQFCRDFTQNRT